MIKKTLSVAAIAAFVVLGGAAAAYADEYPTNLACTAAAPALSPGASTTVSCSDLDEGSVTFEVTGPGVGAGTLASIAFTANSTVSVVKQASPSGDAAVTFTAPGAGTFLITATDEAGSTGSVSISVSAAGSGDAGSANDDLPATGGVVSPGVIWAGVSAIAVGGIVAGVAASRRRTQRH